MICGQHPVHRPNLQGDMTMHDSLDLNALRQEAAAHKKPAPGQRKTAASWAQTIIFGGIGLGAGLLMNTGKLGRGYDVYVNLLAILIIGGVLWQLFKALRDQRRNAPRIEQYAPTFVRRANWQDTVMTVMMYAAILMWMAVARLLTTSTFAFIGI